MIYIFFLFLLLLLNGVLSASEIAYLSLNKLEIANSTNKLDKKINKIIKKDSILLSSIQIGITLSGFLSSALASTSISDTLINNGFYLINETFTKNFLVVIITLLLSYITLVFGEIVPKRLGHSYPLAVARKTIGIITFINTIFYPFIYLLSYSTDFICHLFNIKEKDDSLTAKDLKKMIITGSKEGIIEEKEKDYILNIFKFKDKSAGRIMIPKDQVICLNITDNEKDVLNKIKDSHYTRFPVLDEEKIVGYINIKDFIYLKRNKAKIAIKDILHPVLIFNKSDKIDYIFEKMQEEYENFSIITSKGEFVGILTIDDAISEIVGNLRDEYEK